MTFGGNWPPKMSWSVLDGIDYALDNYTMDHTIIMQNLTVMASVDLDQVSCCQCQVFFALEDKPKHQNETESENVAAINVPEYTFHYNATVITVHCELFLQVFLCMGYGNLV